MDSFGNQVGSTGSSGDPYMFAATSRYRNDGDAGLTLVGARYYDGQVGRFISRDTVLTQKPYLYCDHDPVNGLDPSGHYCWEEFALELAGSVSGVVGGLAVITTVGAVIENNTPEGSLGNKIGGTLSGGGLVIAGLGIALAGASLPVVGAVVAAVAGGYVAFQGVKHVIDVIGRGREDSGGGG